MQNKPNLVLDTLCEVYDLLLPWAKDSFQDFSKHTVYPGAIYLVGRQQFKENHQQLKLLAEQGIIRVILSNPLEGSETLLTQALSLGIKPHVDAGQMLLLGGGDMSSDWKCLQYDSFLPKIYDYDQNLLAADRVDDIFNKTQKPYKFLFLNGRMRANRKYLLEYFRTTGTLDHSLWTSLDANVGPGRHIRLAHNGQNLMETVRPAKTLDPYYEVDRYQHRTNPVTEQSYVKFDLFDQEWGEIYLKPEPYIDTYFSLVTETVFEYPYSFRTEKIWKPIAIGHPFVAAANYGYYRDLRNLGFQTFSHVIDDSFDLIENNQKRIEKIAAVVEDLCRGDLAQLQSQCYNVCKYNQQHLADMRLKVRNEFPERFFQFLKEHSFD
jgi:hypothetical protein